MERRRAASRDKPPPTIRGKASDGYRGSATPKMLHDVANTVATSCNKKGLAFLELECRTNALRIPIDTIVGMEDTPHFDVEALVRH